MVCLGQQKSHFLRSHWVTNGILGLGQTGKLKWMGWTVVACWQSSLFVPSSVLVPFSCDRSIELRSPGCAVQVSCSKWPFNRNAEVLVAGCWNIVAWTTLFFLSLVFLSVLYESTQLPPQMYRWLSVYALKLTWLILYQLPCAPCCRQVCSLLYSRLASEDRLPLTTSISWQ